MYWCQRQCPRGIPVATAKGGVVRIALRRTLVIFLIFIPRRLRIVVTSRSPLKNFWQDPRVEFVAIDFLEPVDAIVQKMLPLCRGVTHAFFTSYVHTDDFMRLRDLNVPLFENFLTAIDTVAGGSLQRVCLQTGGKVGTRLLEANHLLLKCS